MGAVEAFGESFEDRQMEKNYLAIVEGIPRQTEWTCTLPLAPDPRQIGRMIVDTQEGKESETRFRLLQKKKRSPWWRRIPGPGARTRFACIWPSPAIPLSAMNCTGG